MVMNCGELEIDGSRYVDSLEIEAILKLLKENRIHAVVGKAFALEKAEEAHRLLRDDESAGRLAITLA